MPGPVLGALVTIGLFMIAVIFNAGKQAARIDQLEQSRAETREDIVAIRKDIGVVLTLLSKRDEG